MSNAVLEPRRLRKRRLPARTIAPTCGNADPAYKTLARFVAADIVSNLALKDGQTYTRAAKHHFCQLHSVKYSSIRTHLYYWISLFEKTAGAELLVQTNEHNANKIIKYLNHDGTISFTPVADVTTPIAVLPMQHAGAAVPPGVCQHCRFCALSLMQEIPLQKNMHEICTNMLSLSLTVACMCIQLHQHLHRTAPRTAARKIDVCHALTCPHMHKNVA